MNPNEAKIIGHIESDGSLKNNMVRYFSANREMINKFRDVFQETFDATCWKPYWNKTAFETGSKKRSVVRKMFELVEDKKELLINRKSSISYLVSTFDDESTIFLKKRKCGIDREIKMWSKSLDRLEFIKKLLDIHFNINSNIYGPRKVKYFELKIMRKKDLKVFCEKIRLTHPEKSIKQVELLNSL